MIKIKKNKSPFVPAILFAVSLAMVSFSGCEKVRTEPITQTINSHLYENTWATLIYGLGSYNIVCCVETHYNFFDGDSVFNGSTYKKLYCYKDEQHSTSFYEGLVRDNNSKIFFVPKDSSTEYLLYDFSVIEGTSFEYTDYKFSEINTNVYVKNVDYINMNGNNVKRIQLSSPPPYDNNIIDTWYEGIGSEKGFLYPILQLDGGVRVLLCCSQNDTLVYHNTQFSDCYYDNAEEVENIVHPNN